MMPENEIKCSTYVRTYEKKKKEIVENCKHSTGCIVFVSFFPFPVLIAYTTFFILLRKWQDFCDENGKIGKKNDNNNNNEWNEAKKKYE